MRKIHPTFITFFCSILALPLVQAANSPLLLGYWGNWHVWDKDKNGRSEEEYQIPGSINKDTREVVTNPAMQKQLGQLNAVAYAFLEVYPDVGLSQFVPQKPIKTTDIGQVYWSDPWTDLFNNNTNAEFCRSHYTMCYFAYEIEKDPHSPRPSVDSKQPWNYFFMGNFDAFTRLTGVKRIISIGGWYHQASFEQGAFKNPDQFVQSIIDIIHKARQQGGDINGIDLDYEPINGYTAENGKQLAELVKKLRQGLDSHGLASVIITAAVFANEEKILAFGKTNWQALASNLDYIGVMGYDFHGLWDNPPITGLQSNLYADSNNPYAKDFTLTKAIDSLIAMGIAKNKLVLGIPSYGRAVGGVTSSHHNGLYQPFDALAPVPADLDNGQVSYYKIMTQWINHGYQDHTVFYQGKASSSWAWNPNNYQFVSYDSSLVVDSKAEYAVTNGLGGMMMWELISDLSADDKNHPSLLKHMHDGMR